jgi:hypothetical protein
MPFQADRVTIGRKQERLWLDGAALQFGFDRVKDDLGWYHRQIHPEDDGGAREIGSQSARRSQYRCRLA